MSILSESEVHPFPSIIKYFIRSPFSFSLSHLRQHIKKRHRQEDQRRIW